LAEANAIERAAVVASKGRTWLSSESVHFFDTREDGILSGFSKPNFMPHPDEAREAAASGLPDGTILNVVNILVSLSKQYGVDWQVGHDFGELGLIRHGIPDYNIMENIQQISQMGAMMQDFESQEIADEEES